MLELADQWVWDLWLLDTGEEYHLFFLKASRALRVEVRRHRRAAIGHAVSTDLRDWTLLPDALVHSDEPAFDSEATWTGSTIIGPDGTWHLFYTGIDRGERGTVQRIGVATSRDGINWDKAGAPLVEADPRWYETAGDRTWDGVAWRDPWVYADPDGDGWHMLVTARANTGPSDERGVIGHARSRDLSDWTVLAPLTQPGQGFGQLEVPQVALVDGRAVLVFSCLTPELSDAHRLRTGVTATTGGVWTIAADALTGPFDASAAVALTDNTRYSGRLIQDRSGQWVLMSFQYAGPDIDYVGRIGDPEPVRWTADGLAVVEDPGPTVRGVTDLASESAADDRAVPAPPAPTPDDKDWTWVLDLPCPQCGFEPSALTGCDVAASVRAAVPRWLAVVHRADATTRPAPDVWSPAEYACHVVDVFILFGERTGLMLAQDNPMFANWDQDQTALEQRYWERRPADIASALSSAGEWAAMSFDAVRSDQWERPGRRSNGSSFTVDSLGRYFVHDVVHHLHDVDG